MEALGHNGLQLFIDAGQPVDMSLVNSLVKECVLEKVFSMLGKKSDDLQTGMAHTEMRISTGSSTEHGQIRDLQKVLSYYKQTYSCKSISMSNCI